MFAAEATNTLKLILVLAGCAMLVQIPESVFAQQNGGDAFNEQSFGEEVTQLSLETDQPLNETDQPLDETGQPQTKEGQVEEVDSPDPPTASDSDPTQTLLQLQARTQNIIAQSAPAVVAIGETGSGVIINSRGLILTASHVTRFANRKVSVVFSDGRIAQGMTLGSNIASDTGAIQLLSSGPFPFVAVQDSQDAQPGTWCIAMGYPLSFPRGRPAAGRLGRILERSQNGKLISDCTIMGGDSGGPLLNLEGKVIAISSSVKLSADQNLYIPSEQFVKDWQDIAQLIDKTGRDTAVQTTPNPTGGNSPLQNPAAGKAYLGINAETDQNIVRIRAVHRDSPAALAGIKPNDVIVELDSKPIRSFAELVGHLKTRKPGELLLVLINRYGYLIRAEVTLGGTNLKSK